jgi:hypothetical protein
LNDDAYYDYLALLDQAEDVWVGRVKMRDIFDYSQPPTLEEALVAKTFFWNKDVGWSFNDLLAGPLDKGGTCPVARASSTCAKCYAQAGNFLRPSVKRAQVRNKLLLDSRFYRVRMVQGFLWLLETATRKRSCRGIMEVNGVPSLVVREHSSGDYHSPRAINEDVGLCRHLQQVWPEDAPPLVVWVPTRGWALPNLLRHLVHLHRVGNDRVRWVVRPSALDEGPAPEVTGLGPGTGVGYEAGDVVCPKILTHTSCRAQGCTLCWESNKTISYPLHGANKRKVAGAEVVAKQERLLARFAELEGLAVGG